MNIESISTLAASALAQRPLKQASEPLPGPEGETSGFPRRCHSVKGFLKEKSRLLNVKGEKEVDRGGLDREPTETWWLLVVPSRNDSEGSLTTLTPCPTVRKLGQNTPQSPILSVAQ